MAQRLLLLVLAMNARENLVRNRALGESDLQFLKQARSEIDLLLTVVSLKRILPSSTNKVSECKSSQVPV